MFEGIGSGPEESKKMESDHECAALIFQFKCHDVQLQVLRLPKMHLNKLSANSDHAQLTRILNVYNGLKIFDLNDRSEPKYAYTVVQYNNEYLIKNADRTTVFKNGSAKNHMMQTTTYKTFM